MFFCFAQKAQTPGKPANVTILSVDLGSWCPNLVPELNFKQSAAEGAEKI